MIFPIHVWHNTEQMSSARRPFMHAKRYGADALSWQLCVNDKLDLLWEEDVFLHVVRIILSRKWEVYQVALVMLDRYIKHLFIVHLGGGNIIGFRRYANVSNGIGTRTPRQPAHHSLNSEQIGI